VGRDALNGREVRLVAGILGQWSAGNQNAGGVPAEKKSLIAEYAEFAEESGAGWGSEGQGIWFQVKTGTWGHFASG
jgi:hypothetical protein